MTSSAPSARMRPASSSTLPVPNRVAGLGFGTGTSPLALTSRSMAAARPTASSRRACGDRSEGRRPFGRRVRPPRLVSRTGASTTAFARPAIRARPGSRGVRSFLRFSSRGSVGRNYLLSGTFRLGNICELNGLTGHDGRDGVLVDELRMSVAAEQDAEIVEPGHDALQLHPIHEKDRQRSLVLANMIEKSVLK